MYLDRKTPIPSPLWSAILAAGSKQRTVWDEIRGVVRPARPEEMSDTLPTFTKEELSQLRSAFVERHRRELNKREQSLLLEYLEGKCPRDSVPFKFRAGWSKYLESIVRERLERHFAERELRRKDEPTSEARIEPDQVSEEPDMVSQTPPLTEEELADNQLVSDRRNTGDSIGVGETLARKFRYVDESALNTVFANVVAAWASPVRIPPEFGNTTELAIQSHEFVLEHLSLAFVHAYARLRALNRSLPASINDLVFRLAGSIAEIFTIGQRLAPVPLATRAVARLESELVTLQAAVTAFQSTNALTAKSASIEVVKAARSLGKFTLPNERPILANIDRLLGPAFRKFCESCERHEDSNVIRRVPEIREQLAASGSVSNELRSYSRLWHEIVQPVFQHIEVLLDEGLRRSEIAASPSLSLAEGVVKLDLTGRGPQPFSCRLLNRGDGRALEVAGVPASQGSIKLDILDPSQPFEVGGRSERYVTFIITVSEQSDRIEIPLTSELLTWFCEAQDNLAFFGHRCGQ